MSEKKFECRQCGSCCSAVLPLSKKESDKIKTYIKKNHVFPVNRNNALTNEYVNICPFLNNNKTCNIYKVRPEICKWFRCDLAKNGGNKSHMNHLGKKIINMYTEFFPNSFCPDVPFMEKATEFYNLQQDKFNVKK